MSTRSALRAALSCSVLLFTAAARADDLADLQGTWTGATGPEGQVAVSLVFDGPAVTIIFKAPERDGITLKGKVALDEKATPKTIDWTEFTRPDGSPAPKNLGIYKLEGDTFTVCNGGPDAPRPTEFASDPAGPARLVEFKRQPKTP